MEVDVSGDGLNGVDGIDLGVHPRSTGEDGREAFDDDFLAGFGEEEPHAHFVLDDGVGEVVDVGA